MHIFTHDPQNNLNFEKWEVGWLCPSRPPNVAPEWSGWLSFVKNFATDVPLINECNLNRANHVWPQIFTSHPQRKELKCRESKQG